MAATCFRRHVHGRGLWHAYGDDASARHAAAGASRLDAAAPRDAAAHADAAAAPVASDDDAAWYFPMGNAGAPDACGAGGKAGSGHKGEEGASHPPAAARGQGPGAGAAPSQEPHGHSTAACSMAAPSIHGRATIHATVQLPWTAGIHAPPCRLSRLREEAGNVEALAQPELGKQLLLRGPWAPVCASLRPPAESGGRVCGWFFWLTGPWRSPPMPLSQSLPLNQL
mmetsp:Transcript_35108/g.113093  ORF Transcript_35108/g.113093 Transcript_35108/m.113093 type:complete len:226 (-) Transcript_35108:136-813(-)